MYDVHSNLYDVLCDPQVSINLMYIAGAPCAMYYVHCICDMYIGTLYDVQGSYKYDVHRTISAESIECIEALGGE